MPKLRQCNCKQQLKLYFDILYLQNDYDVHGIVIPPWLYFPPSIPIVSGGKDPLSSVRIVKELNAPFFVCIITG